ncbi:MAG: hypothetical protein QM702_21795 [Rubrivivax sp.]
MPPPRRSARRPHRRPTRRASNCWRPAWLARCRRRPASSCSSARRSARRSGRIGSPVGAPIRPETFKVYYGAFRIDITARIAGAARVTAEGVDVAQAVLPSGSHKLLLEVQDGAGRTGERLLQFSVE